MISKNIIVSKESFESADRYDIVYSNIKYIDQLFKNNISDDQIFEDALKSYHIDSYLAQIYHGGFSTFVKNFTTKYKNLYYIGEGLKAINANYHLKLLNQSINHQKLRGLDTQFIQLQESENLLNLHYRWLINHPKLMILTSKEISSSIAAFIQKSTATRRHVNIIKKLCEKVNDEYLRITAGDPNNIYSQSWYFKTTTGYFYMIENKGRAKMFNSYTKREIVSLSTPQYNF